MQLDVERGRGQHIKHVQPLPVKRIHATACPRTTAGADEQTHNHSTVVGGRGVPSVRDSLSCTRRRSLCRKATASCAPIAPRIRSVYVLASSWRSLGSVLVAASASVAAHDETWDANTTFRRAQAHLCGAAPVRYAWTPKTSERSRRSPPPFLRAPTVSRPSDGVYRTSVDWRR